MSDTLSAVPAQVHATRRRRMRLSRFLLRRDPVATVVLWLFVVLALLGPLVTPYAVDAVDLGNRLAPPGAGHLLGTDEFGRDLLSRVIASFRVAGEAILIVLLVGGMLGTLVGAVAGGVGGATDYVLSRGVELLQGFPIVLLALAIVAIAGPSLLHAMLAVGIGAIPDFARIARSIAIQLRDREFVDAARIAGASEARVLRTEVLPNMFGPLVVVASFVSAQAVLYEAGLSFLGLGVQLPQPSFGGLLSDAKNYLASDPYYLIVVGVPLSVLILVLNLVGDALSDYFEMGGGR